MKLLRTVVLSAAVAGSVRCGGGAGDWPDIAGAWAGTMDDVAGTRAVVGSCNQTEDRPRCFFAVTDTSRATTSRAVLTGWMVLDSSAASEGPLSFYVGVEAPPCSINVTGRALVSGGAIQGTYHGANTCSGEAISDGRLSLARQ
jgi:hypothetical protein